MCSRCWVQILQSSKALTRLDCRWIAGKISEILGSEDDVVIELCFNLLEGARFVRVADLLLSRLANPVTNSLISKSCKFSLPASLIRILLGFAKSYGRYA